MCKMIFRFDFLLNGYINFHKIAPNLTYSYPLKYNIWNILKVIDQPLLPYRYCDRIIIVLQKIYIFFIYTSCEPLTHWKLFTDAKT